MPTSDKPKAAPFSIDDAISDSLDDGNAERGAGGEQGGAASLSLDHLDAPPSEEPSEEDAGEQTQRLDAFSAEEDDDYGMGSETRMITLPKINAPSELPSAKDAARLQPLPAGLMAFVVVDGEAFRISKPLTIIGRVKEVCDVAIVDDQVSRHHAAVIYSGGAFYVEDLDSTNGTFIDGKRTKRSELKAGVEVRVGGRRGFSLRVD